MNVPFFPFCLGSPFSSKCGFCFHFPEINACFLNPWEGLIYTLRHLVASTRRLGKPHARIQEFSSGGGGVQVSLTKKKKTLTTFFFVFVFLVLSLFYNSQLVIFKEIYHFSRFQRGSNIFRGGGGSNFFQRGSNCLFPIETHITCDFPGGGGLDPCPPSGSALEPSAHLHVYVDFLLRHTLK